MPQPTPDRRPKAFGVTSRAIIALLNTADISAAIAPIANAPSASGMAPGRCGSAHQSATQDAASIAEHTAMYGFFGPVASATLPSRGDSTARTRPAPAVA